MKILKSGFSLAEILMALAIVAVIATMGFTFANKAIDRAYNMYVYTGYKGLTDAFAEANARGQSITENSDNFLREVADILSIEGENLRSLDANNWVLRAPNDIIYVIRPFTVGDWDDYITILMNVPARQTRTAENAVRQVNSVCMYYRPDHAEHGNIFIPTDSIGGRINCNTSIENIQQRRDLLPFYIDNGIVGRRINGRYTPREYTDFRTAYCRTHTIEGGILSNPNDNINAIIDCTGFNDPQAGVVRSVNPRALK